MDEQWKIGNIIVQSKRRFQVLHSENWEVYKFSLHLVFYRPCYNNGNEYFRIFVTK